MKKSKQLLRSRRGVTMAELIVTFALLALFCVGFTYVIATSLNIYRNVIGEARGQQVGEILMEKITGEIAGAQGGAKPEYVMNVLERSRIPAGKESDYLGTEYADGTVIAFYNRDGSPVYLYVRDGRLVIHYRPLTTEVNLTLKAVDWTFDDGVYDGFAITGLQFSLLEEGGQRTNVIRIELTLENGTGYQVTATEYVECYHFAAEDLFKINYAGIQTDAAYEAEMAQTKGG